MDRRVLLPIIPLVFASYSYASDVNQEFSDFSTPLPLKSGDTLILGAVGGWERWDAPQLNLAAQLVERAFPQSPPGSARVILNAIAWVAWPQSVFARDLDAMGFPVLALILIDAIGVGSR